MKEVLSQYLHNVDGSKITINGIEGYRIKNHIYFIIPTAYSEEVHYEQKAIADFLHNQGMIHVATPIFSHSGYIVTQYDQKTYVVLEAQIKESLDSSLSNGCKLAMFHNAAKRYPYEPKHLSSYGKWRTLWANKLAFYEEMYVNKTTTKASPFHRLFVDTFPYMIGLTENALQYLQETELDTRYNETDRGTINFIRYNQQLDQQIIFPQDLVYDHPARDIAEYIRFLLLQEIEDPFQQIQNFLQEYGKQSQMSIFCWRLIYGRLLFPTHLFDELEKGFQSHNLEYSYKQFKEILKKQTIYEKYIKSFFGEIGMDAASLQIPIIDW
ncbi:spore coat protein YutH [Aquibacillus sp. 3ASR75-11]|uniref:Spore coat protein YutH n=1 Tax=Terrihalobacillus insolitus TaxID=2950438 RepID=A0A9X3WNI8_9BACI|nr:spore coat protein YutH [Terrihalobacillus insolitus]MDC3412362.1 spore coat protein YutH [Terrihalobacillus insolitus]MDC3422945.1 spore coat protein YutH [Terrihalobacillus insolitus]